MGINNICRVLTMDYNTALEIAQKLTGGKGDSQVTLFAAHLLVEDYYSRNLPILKQALDKARNDYESSSAHSSQEASTSTQLSEEYLIKLITPDVKRIRKKFFGSRLPPFATSEDADNWINRSFEEAIRHFEERKLMFTALSMKRGDTAKDYNEEAARIAEKLTFKQLETYYNKAGTQAELEEPVLLKCLNEARAIAEATGFLRYPILVFILTDIEPRLFRINTDVREEVHKLPSKTKIVNRYAVLTLRGEVAFPELYSAYKDIRKQLGIRRKKDFKEKHLNIYRLVQEEGEPPEGEGTVAFWRSVENKWNSLYPKNKYKHWKSIKMAYDRTISKLKNRFEMEQEK
jgi:hypothetical protein